MKSTLLWSNPNPNAAFGSQTVNLNDNINNYDYIKVTCRYDVNSSTQTSMLMSVNDFKNSVNSAGKLVLPLASIVGSSYGLRFVYYANGTQVAFDARGSGDYQIPLAIYGMKYVSSGGSAKIGTVTVNTSSTVSVNVGFRPSMLIVSFYTSDSYWRLLKYISSENTNHIYIARTNSTPIVKYLSFPSTETGSIASIDSNGFTMAKISSTQASSVATTGTYIAIP